MKTLLLNGQELLKLGFPQGKVIGLIIRLVSENYTEEQKEYVLNFLRGIIKHPARFKEHTIFGEVAATLAGEARRAGHRASLNEVLTGKPMLTGSW